MKQDTPRVGITMGYPAAGPSFPPETTRLESHGKSWSTRSGVGVIFYF